MMFEIMLCIGNNIKFVQKIVEAVCLATE